MARKPVLIRIPEELYDALAKWADDKLRSTNAQIEYLLQDAVKKAGRSKKPKAVAEPPPRADRSATKPTDDEADADDPAP
ncbi:MAG: Arc family DNA-binding protein [Myxococcales bacterium]|nr:Arc family DNA-binding protein [Myxococcales bacterium]